MALVVGHELAHQWFGNLVTMVTCLNFATAANLRLTSFFFLDTVFSEDTEILTFLASTLEGNHKFKPCSCFSLSLFTVVEKRFSDISCVWDALFCTKIQPEEFKNLVFLILSYNNVTGTYKICVCVPLTTLCNTSKTEFSGKHLKAFIGIEENFKKLFFHYCKF